MIAEWGVYSLIVGFIFALLGTLSTGVLLCPRFRCLENFVTPSVYGQCFFVLLSFLCLILCFVENDFSVAYVASNSNTHLPLHYKICAVWGSHEGSLLLWALILTGWMVTVAIYIENVDYKARMGILGVLSAINIGFLFLLLHTSNPFLRILPSNQEQGADLNPLLQDPAFVLHPPFLYLGYVGLAVPFAFAFVSLCLNNNLNNNFNWAPWARPFTLIAWAFLTIGILLGSWWAYYELGWGGWWFWDPVENASLMPWLVAGALVHALILSAKRQLFDSWAIFLALCAFILSLIGTFLVRSGVIASVHAFASDPKRGSFILVFLSAVMAIAFGLYFLRLFRNKHSPIRETHFLSKVSFLMLGNILLFIAAATILLGTLYPLGIEIVTGEKASVGPPYFNAVFIPIMIPLLLLMTFGPYIQWDQDSLKSIWQKAKKLIILLIVLGLASLLMPVPLSFLSKIGVLLGVWLVIASLYRIGKRSLNRWGMCMAHAGMGITVLGVVLTTALETEKTFKMAVGESVSVGEYQLNFLATHPIMGSNYRGIRGEFVLKKENKELVRLMPEKRFFMARNQTMTETAISPGLMQDFYLALGDLYGDNSWSLRFYIKPAVRWIWIGAFCVALGAFLSGIAGFRKHSKGLKA